MGKDIKITYDKNSEFAGHQHNESVSIVDAVKDIFHEVKENAMQLAVGGAFKEFNTLSELRDVLEKAHDEGGRIWLCDEDIGG